MSWTPVDDSQTANWNPLVPVVAGGWGTVPASNTPSWNVIRAIADGAFQLGAFQPAFQIGFGSVWSPVDDSQATVWVPIPP
jgi:hypothetical protein